ncbi:facilitated trehalose transporter Tret1-like [Daktulosphaira vitifoliae]|uniref:facilitated trehalose transporter Tret1-like n=1 Tax=Daktulosphaira vitifoliae TaxID=58002 RepID=UPI0021AA3813|nr:facilitated trehalose transporter Tret1-like [Daktulosphaira vitifoliae]XP_050533261.1 facilitated trehalose transporter Tret1-like [Daktulosphaira vitifoliae]
MIDKDVIVGCNRNYDQKALLAQLFAVITQSLLLVNLGMEIMMPTLVLGELYKNSNIGFSLTDTEASWYGSILFVCQPPGSFIAGFLQEKIGRKRCMILAIVPSFIGWILLYFCYSSTMLFIATVSMGLGIGFCEAPVFSYIGEVTEPRLRGQMSSLASAGVMFGAIINSSLGFFFGSRITALISLIIPISCVCLICMIPESPIWFLTKGRTEDARKSLCWLRGWVYPSEIEEEFNEIVRYVELSGNKNENKIQNDVKMTSKIAMFKNPMVYRPLRMLLLFFMFSQLLSIIPVRPYIMNLLTEVGLGKNQTLIVMFLSISQIIPCIMTTMLVKIVGKRFLALFALSANTMILLAFGVYLILIKAGIFTSIPWIFFLLIFAIYFFAYTLIAVPWMVISEIYPNNVRSVATGISSAFSYILMFLWAKSYLSIEEFLSLEYTMILFGSIGIIGIFYLYFNLPETENKTLMEIEDYFISKKKNHSINDDIKM